MNCKQGDIAIIVRSYAGNEGKIVQCLEYAGLMPWQEGGIIPTWRIDVPLTGMRGEVDRYCPDFQLRPIRDTDGDDEVLLPAQRKDDRKVPA